MARVDACRLGPGRRHDWHGQPALSALLRRAAVRGQPPGCASPSWRGGAGARDGALLLHLLPSRLARAGREVDVRAPAVRDALDSEDGFAEGAAGRRRNGGQPERVTIMA